jgi:hypothetical protein
MALYATLAELASYMQRTVDNSTGTLLLTIASDLFCERARTRFESNATTYSEPGTGESTLILPKAPIIAVSAVRVGGVVVTDYTRMGQQLYRRIGWGTWWAFPPTLIEVDYTYGYTVVPDDVKGAVLETAAGAYENPVSPNIARESIDDYSITYGAGTSGVRLSKAASDLADMYAGTLCA